MCDAIGAEKDITVRVHIVASWHFTFCDQCENVTVNREHLRRHIANIHYKLMYLELRTGAVQCEISVKLLSLFSLEYFVTFILIIFLTDNNAILNNEIIHSSAMK